MVHGQVLLGAVQQGTTTDILPVVSFWRGLGAEGVGAAREGAGLGLGGWFHLKLRLNSSIKVSPFC